MTPRLTLRTAIYALALIVLLAIILMGMSWCADRDRLKEAKADRQLAEGRTTSAVEAITQIGELGQRADATDAQVKEAQDALHQAAPADRDRVFRAQLCRLQHRPDCDRLLGTGAGGADHADAAR